MIDPNEKGVITRTQAVCRGSPKSFNISEQLIYSLSAKTIQSLDKLQKYEIPSGVIERIKPKELFNNMTEKKQSTEFFYKEYARCFGSLPEVWKVSNSLTLNIGNKEVREKQFWLLYTHLSHLLFPQ